jgi:hypothetical protein
MKLSLKQAVESQVQCMYLCQTTPLTYIPLFHVIFLIRSAKLAMDFGRTDAFRITERTSQSAGLVIGMVLYEESTVTQQPFTQWLCSNWGRDC